MVRYSHYYLYRQGPDDNSTYAECWGMNASRGRLLATAYTAEGIRRAVAHEGGWGGLQVYGKRLGKMEPLTREEVLTRAERERKRHPNRMWQWYDERISIGHD